MTAARRVDALDAFRGITVAGMILVNSPGDWDAVYWPLEHAAWHGWTAADLVFPFFLFAMGAAVPLAFGRRRGRVSLARHVFRRGAILFGLGLLLNAITASTPIAWSTFRIAGVLQRIAVVFVAVAWLVEKTSRRVQVITAIALLIGYWILMRMVPVPGAGAGVLTPEGNLASYVDRLVLGRHVGFGMSDPEGILSTLPAIATALCGVFAGDWLTRSEDQGRRDGVLAIAGVAAIATALAWDRVFPINKNLWTSSFALLTAGCAAILFALFHFVIDIRRWRAWADPFVALGRNTLGIYILSVAIDALLGRWPLAAPDYTLKWRIYAGVFERSIAPCCGAHAASATYAVCYVALWCLVAMAMYRYRLFVGV